MKLPSCTGLFVKPHKDLNPCPLSAFLRRCLAFRMPTCQQCQQVGATKEWLFSHVLTQGCLRGLGFSSISEFIDDFNRKEHNAKKKEWRLKNKDDVNAKEREKKAAEYAQDPEKE